MLAPIAHILPLTTVRRERLLPLPGRVTVREGQKINPLDVVAEAHFGEQHQLVDVARILELPPAAAQKLLQVKAGEHVSKGDVIARKMGLIPQAVRAPVSGQVLVTGSGQVLLETGENTLELRAGMPGQVSRLVNERGVEITFSGALIQGVWGNGEMNMGMMLPVLEAPDEPLTGKKLDVSMRGSVILCGTCSEPQALQTAAELPVRGLILGSLAPALIPQALQVKFPIVLVEGIGRRPLNSVAYKLLATNAKREVTLNAAPMDRQSGARPEIFIPLPVSQEPALPSELEEFAPNQQVRLTRDPHCGEIGQIARILPGLTLMPSGLRVPAAEVRTEGGDLVLTPLANLELLG